MGVFHDISDIKKREEKYRRLALHDPLTGLPNRQLMEDRLDRAMASAKRNGKRLAVLFVDLDGFKGVNDTHGHHAGDLLLQEAGRRLSASCREEDTVSRLGGDEFTIIMPDLAGGLDYAASAARRLLASFTGPFIINGVSLDIHASAGIAVFPEHGADSQALMESADKAMYRAKKTPGPAF